MPFITKFEAAVPTFAKNICYAVVMDWIDGFDVQL